MQGQARLSGFLAFYAIADLLMCFLRLLAGIAAGAVLLDPQLATLSAAVRHTIPSKFVTAVGVAVFGIAANCLILARKPSAVTLRWIAVGFTFMNLGVNIWQTILQNQESVGHEADQAARLLGVTIAIIIRLALVSVYGLMLTQVKSSPARSDEFSNYAY